MHDILKEHYRKIGAKGGKAKYAHMTEEERKAYSKYMNEKRRQKLKAKKNTPLEP